MTVGPSADNFCFLDNAPFRCDGGGMLDVAVIDDPAVAEVALDPTRARLLAALTAPQGLLLLAVSLGAGVLLVLAATESSRPLLRRVLADPVVRAD